MGNRAILDRPAPVPAAAPAPSPPTSSRPVLWEVYRMRERGIQLTRGAVQRGRLVGVLTIDKEQGPSLALLTGTDGTVLAELEGPQIRSMLASGAMQLRGVEAVQEAAGLKFYPQTWWCALVPPDAV